MSRHYFHRSDNNAKEIYGYLSKLGITYEPVGVVDLICGYGGVTCCAEIRQKGKPRESREGRQKRFHARWTGGIYWLSDWEDCVRMKQTMMTYLDNNKRNVGLPLKTGADRLAIFVTGEK